MSWKRLFPCKSWNHPKFPIHPPRRWTACLLAVLVALASAVRAQDESPAGPEPGALSAEVPLFDPAAKAYFREFREVSTGARTVRLTDVRWSFDTPFAEVLDWYAGAFHQREIALSVRTLDDGRQTAEATFAIGGEGQASVFLVELDSGGVRLHITQRIPQPPAETPEVPVSFGRELPADFPAAIPLFDTETKPYFSKRYRVSGDLDWNGGKRDGGFTATDVRWDLEESFDTVAAWYEGPLQAHKVALTAGTGHDGRAVAHAVLPLSETESASITLVEAQGGGVRLHIVWCAPPAGEGGK